MKMSRDNMMCFEKADFEQCTFSEQKVRLDFNGNVIIIFFFF